MATRSRVSVFVVAGLTLTGVLTAPGFAHVSAAPLTPGFGEPAPSGIVGDGFEQDLRIAPPSRTGAEPVIYSSAPVGLGSSSVIWRSLDGGRTFKYVPSQIPPYGKPIACVGGGDSELAVDAQGRLYFADLYLANFATGRSDDRGRTWNTATNCAGVADTPVDRQWYTTLGDPTSGSAGSGLFLVYDETPSTGVLGSKCPANIGNILSIARSPGFAEPGTAAGALFSKPKALSCDEGIMGNDVSFTYPANSAHPSLAGPRVFVIHDNGALNDITIDRCAVIAPTATNRQGLNCTKDLLVASFPHARTGANFPTISVDTQGNLFAVWEEAPLNATGKVSGNTQLFFATSGDEGTTWSPPRQLPTPGLNQDVMAWPGSGDPGRVDVAFYGTPAAWKAGDVNGPDSISGEWSLYVVQTLDDGTTWSPPALASEHFIHVGSMQTLIGHQNGNRGVGDFLQLRIGSRGEAEVSYADTNLFEGNSDLSPEAMFVRQISGPSVYASQGTVAGSPPPAGGCVSDPQRDAVFQANGVDSPDTPDLDILRACMSQPDAAHYRITMKIADLTTLGPDPQAGGTVNIWQMQWHVPSHTDPQGGKLFMAYMESDNGGPPACWVGQSSQQEAPGGAELTYPGTTQLPQADCKYTATAPGTITITVPVADVSEPGAINSTLYSVAASTQTVEPPNAESPPPVNTVALGVVAGQLPNLVDVAAAFDVNAAPATNVPEVPWTPLLMLTGVIGMAGALQVRRRRGTKHMWETAGG